MLAHFLRGFTLIHLGELDAALADIEHAATLYHPQLHHALTSLYGGNPSCEVANLDWKALTLWLGGYPDQAQHGVHEALSLARELTHPFALSYALLQLAFLYCSLKEWPLTQEWSEALLALSTEQGYMQWLAPGNILRGVALVHQGQMAEGLSQVQQGFAMLRATGVKIERAFFLAQQAEAYGIAGQPEDGLPLVAEALTHVEQTRERWWAADVHRLKGELVLNDERGMMNDEWGTGEAGGLSQAAEAEACFQKALDIARQQGAKTLELRAATSLARLWHQQGKTTEARDLLAPVYDWFTEGFDTADLRDAKALLGELL